MKCSAGFLYDDHDRRTSYQICTRYPAGITVLESMPWRYHAWALHDHLKHEGRRVKAILAVGLGGLMGSLARYKLGGLVLRHSTSWHFPFSTFAVNLVGCALVGVLVGIAEQRHGLSPTARLFLITGFCGGFTTFSAFGFETVFLLRRHEAAWAVANVVFSVFAGIGAVWLGWRTVELLTP